MGEQFVNYKSADFIDCSGKMSLCVVSCKKRMGEYPCYKYTTVSKGIYRVTFYESIGQKQKRYLTFPIDYKTMRGGRIVMNEEIILGMVGPYVKDGTITYNEFDQIFSILSRKEQYTVTDILYKNGIDLVDAHIEDDILVLDVDSEDGFDEGLEDDNFEVLYDEALFKDNGVHESENEHLIVHKNIRQSNEILCSLIQQGNRQAVQDLCIKNKRLVDKYVIAYEKRYGNHLDFEDLEQVGFLGLIKAAQRFDIHQGTSFSTYAVFWIKQSISREIMDNGYAIRIPVHMMEKISKVVVCHNRLAGEGVPPQERVLQISSQLEYSVDDVRECLKLKKNFLGYTSLDVPIGEDSDSELGDFIPAEEEYSVEQMAFNKALRHEMENVLMTLPPRERDILKLRFGWDDNHPRTLEEISIKYDVTRERIRQIEAKALRKLRHPTRSRRLKDFVEE